MMILRERYFVTIMTGAGLACMLTLVLPKPTNLVFATETQAYRFYLQKTHLAMNPDVIVIGDSRTLRGVSPSAMADYLPHLRIFNFAFNAGGLNGEMYGAAESRLNPASRARAIVIGITPLAFQEFKSRNEQYREYMDKPADDIYIKLRYPGPVDYFQPRRLSDLVSTILDIEPHTRYEQVFHPDGWIASDRTPLVPREAFDLYQLELAGHQVSKALVAEMLEQTRIWTASGIRVCAFRPPTSCEMEAMEDSVTKFNEQELIESFEAAGGIWLPVDRDGYETYDGSHLRKNDAVRFSASLAKSLEPVLCQEKD